jgi:hypothetical protein
MKCADNLVNLAELTDDAAPKANLSGICPVRTPGHPFPPEKIVIFSVRL